jgi:Undecaprenyl-phosphate galactose phosphotransferase WbaP
LGFVDSPNGHAVSGAIREQLLGSLDELDGILIKQPVDEVLIALPAKSCYNEIQTALKTCERVGIEAKYLFDIFDFSRVRLNPEARGSVPVVSLGLAQDDYRLLIKRLLDIGGAILGLAIVGPLMLAIAAVIKATSPGPAMYRQQRCGWHQRRFYIYKFRTMVPDADHVLAGHLDRNRALRREWESDHKLRDDPRVTRIGRLLRKTSMDELPQLLNVLRGEMSLVGPRPIVDSEVPRYGDSFALYRQAIPGLTGLWQVSGRNDRSYQERVDLDSHYIRNWSLKYDSYILLRTIKVLITRYGAY